jgi:hypothetical protein
MRVWLGLLCALSSCANPALAWTATTEVTDTLDADGPYRVTGVLSTQGSVESATLWVQVDTAPFQAIAMLRESTDDRQAVYSGLIPGTGGGAHVRYLLEAIAEDGARAAAPAGATQAQGPYFSFRVLTPPCGDCTPPLPHPRRCQSDNDCLTTEVCDEEHGACVPR